MGVKIAGCGKALPKLTVTNNDLAQLVDTSDEWIVERTGIHERHIAVEEGCTDLAEQAALQALDAAGFSPQDIDLIICMTISPDSIVPAQACLIRKRLGAENAIAFDLNAACSGCIYGIEVASTMIEASVAVEKMGSAIAHNRNHIRRALVVGAERLSRIVDWTDRSTCVLFGDGSGATVLEWSDDASGILASVLANTDDDTLSLAVDANYDVSDFPFGENPVRSVYDLMGIECPACEPDAPTPIAPVIRMQGQQVFKFASSAMAHAIETVCERAGIAPSDVACVIPHQANERIIRFAAKKTHLPFEVFQVSIGSVGNTSASSVLMALADAYASGKIKPGDYVVLVGFGGGLTSGAIVFQA